MEPGNRTCEAAGAREERARRAQDVEAGEAGAQHATIDREEAIDSVRPNAPRITQPSTLVAVAVWCVLLIGCSGSSPMTPTPTPSPAPSPAPAPGPTGPLLVTRVIDGDTIVVESVGTVRLIGVDTPETVDPREPVGCFGPEASAFTRAMATGKMVRLDYDVDRFDRFERTLAYIYLPDGSFLNAELVRQGYGRAYTFFPFRYLDDFRALERDARDAGRGLWSACAVS